MALLFYHAICLFISLLIKSANHYSPAELPLSIVDFEAKTHMPIVVLLCLNDARNKGLENRITA
jgi:hypothetical protein